MPEKDKISASDFASKIKLKYPEYKDIDDSVLASKMVEKYPEYKDVVYFETLKKKESTPSVSSNTQLPLPSRVPKETSPVLTDLSFKNINQSLPSGGAAVKDVSEIDNIASSIKKGQLQGKIANTLPIGRVPNVDELGKVAEYQKELQSIPASENEQAFQNEGFAIFKNPLRGAKFLTETIASSLSSLFESGKRTVPAAVGIGAVAGAPFAGIGALAGAGTGLTSGLTAAGVNLSTSGKILELLQSEGVDITDKNSLVKAFSDENKMAKLRSKANKYAIPIAVFDVASAGIGGKLIQGAVGKSIAKKALAGLGEAGIQAVMGSGGELSGQLASGQKVDWNEVALEGISSLATDAPDVAIGAIRERAKASSNNKTIARQVATLGKEAGVEDATHNLNRDLANGIISEEEHAQGLKFAQKAAEVAAKIPDDVAPENKAKSIELIVGREEAKAEIEQLEAEKKTLDEAYHAELDEAIKAKKETVEGINKEVAELSKEKVKPEIQEEPLVTEAEIKTPQIEEQDIEILNPTEVEKTTTETVSEVKPTTEEPKFEEQADYITDDNGEKLTVFHGSKGGGALEKFDLEEAAKNRKAHHGELGIHFGTEKNEMALKNTKGEKPQPYNIKFTRELELGDEADRFFPLTRMNVLGFIDILPDEVKNFLPNTREGMREMLKGDYVKSIKDALLENGYDVVSYNNHTEDESRKNYIALRPEQIEYIGKKAEPKIEAPIKEEVKVEAKAETPKEQVKPIEKTRQEKINDLVDRASALTAMRSNAPERASVKNKLDVDAAEFGLKYSERDGKLVNEKGNEIQKREPITNKTVVKDFDRKKYSKETNDSMDFLADNPTAMSGFEIVGTDGKRLSKKQIEQAAKSIKEGKVNYAAKTMFDFIEKAHKQGGIELEDTTTGQRALVPIKEYFDALKTEEDKLRQADVEDLVNNKELEQSDEYINQLIEQYEQEYSEENNESKPTSEGEAIKETSTGTSVEENGEKDTKLEESRGEKPPIEPPTESENKGQEEPFKQRMRSFYKNVINRAKGLTADEKKLLQENPNALYDVLPHAESRKIAKELIDEIGVEKAILEATDKSSGLAPVERVMILGAAMDYYSGLAKEQAKLGNEKSVIELANKEIDAQEKMLQIADTLATMGTDYGRAISIFNEVYKLSNIALERKLKNKVDEVNKARNANSTQQAKDIAKIVSNDEAPISEAAQDLTETQLMREADAMRKVKELEKEVEDLKKEILQRDNAAKGTKKNPLKIKRVTNDTEYDKRLKEFQQRQRSIISKDDVTDLTYFGLYHIENGLTKFADWYNVMSRKFSGFKDSLHDIYKNARDKAVSSGADLKEFDTDENIAKFFEDKKVDSDAKKMLAATKRAAKAKLKEIEENDPIKARNVAPKFAAERIRKDAENNLDMPSTKKEQTYLKKLVQVINQKAKEYYKEKKENVKNINDILAFAIANGKKDFDIWERTKVEVENQIDADENLTEEQKAEVKDFLNDYTESIFDTLLTKNQIEETIRQKLIENGFRIEKVVNGKVVKSVDWNKIIGNAKNIKEAKEKIVKSIADLGINLDEAKGEIDAILNQFDSKVTDKKTAAINAYLNKGIVNKVKSALGKKQANKTQISKLVEMNNKGILNDERVKDVLAEELGIISLSKEDLAKVRELSTQIDRDDIPEFMRKQFQEQLQYLFDSKSGNLPYLENRESVMANRLSSVYNQIQNSTGFFRVISTLATIAAKTKNPKIAARVFGRELLNSIQDAKTILLKGRVSRGSSFSDLTMTTEGEPRVRYLEQGKGKFLSGSFLGRPLYVKMGNKSIDVNPINQAYSRVKYIQRLLEAVDTPSSGISSGLTQYWQIGKAIDKYYPELSPQEKAKKVWDIMYSLDREAEVPNAIQMLKNAGVENPTQAEINRTINEKQERLRNDLMAKEFNKQLDSIKPIAENKLKDDGNANPTSEQIQEQAYKMLGYDEPLDAVARGERQAARETGKSTTVGITSVLLMPLDAMQKRISMGMKKNTTKSGQIAANSVDAVFSQLFPFAHSIGRWTEMQLELTPYGALKGLLYKSGLARDIQGGDKSKISKQEYSELGDDYIIRSVLGAAYTVAAMGAIGLAKKMAGDDDEAEDAIIGTDKAEKFTQERVQSVGKPKESIRIGGHNLPIQLLGNEGVILGMYADYLKKRKDPAYAEKSMLYISAAVVMNSLSESGWYSNANKYGGVASSIIKGKEETYEPALGKVMGGLIGSQVPFNRGQVELATVLNPESKSSKEFGVNLQNQFSIVRAFDKTKPNFDFRGRTYEYGDIYVNSADGVMKMFSKAKYGDKIDEFLADINFAATDAYRTTKEEDNYKYAIENKDGTKRFMTNEEYYDFKFAAAKEFNRLIELNFDVIKSEEIQSKGVVDNIKTMAARKELASYLWNESKSKAIKEVQLQATGSSRARISRQEEREKDREQMQKERFKNKLKGIGANY